MRNKKKEKATQQLNFKITTTPNNTVYPPDHTRHRFHPVHTIIDQRKHSQHTATAARQSAMLNMFNFFMFLTTLVLNQAHDLRGGHQHLLPTCGARPGAPESEASYCTIPQPHSTIDDTPARYHNFLELQSSASLSRSPCTNLQATCKAGGPHATSQHAVTAILSDAGRYKPVFDAMLDQLYDTAVKGGFSQHVSISKAGNKGSARCIEKINQKYGCSQLYGARQLSDVVRGSLIFDTEASLCALIRQTLMTDTGTLLITADASNKIDPKTNKKYLPATLHITNSKNRFKKNAMGMRDYLVNIRMILPGDPVGHVGELQLHHHAMMEAKHHFHCVYSYLRRIDEARSYLKLPDGAIFCPAAKCQQYYVDKKRTQKDGSFRSILDIIRTKWVECDGSATQRGNKYCKHNDRTATPETKEFWHRLIQPYLKPHMRYGVDEYPEGAIDRQASAGYFGEHTIYAVVKAEMVKRYDEAAFDIFGDGHLDETKPNTNQHCPPKNKNCKCSQHLSLNTVDSFPTVERQTWPEVDGGVTAVTVGTMNQLMAIHTCSGELRKMGMYCAGVASEGGEKEEENEVARIKHRVCGHFVTVCALDMCDLLNNGNRQYGHRNPVVAEEDESELHEVNGEKDEDDDIYD